MIVYNNAMTLNVTNSENKLTEQFEIYIFEALNTINSTTVIVSEVIGDYHISDGPSCPIRGINFNLFQLTLITINFQYKVQRNRSCMHTYKLVETKVRTLHSTPVILVHLTTMIN